MSQQRPLGIRRLKKLDSRLIWTQILCCPLFDLFFLPQPLKQYAFVWVKVLFYYWSSEIKLRFKDSPPWWIVCVCNLWGRKREYAELNKKFPIILNITVWRLSHWIMSDILSKNVVIVYFFSAGAISWRGGSLGSSQMFTFRNSGNSPRVICKFCWTFVESREYV